MSCLIWIERANVSFEIINSAKALREREKVRFELAFTSHLDERNNHVINGS